MSLEGFQWSVLPEETIEEYIERVQERSNAIELKMLELASRDMESQAMADERRWQRENSELKPIIPELQNRLAQIKT